MALTAINAKVDGMSISVFCESCKSSFKARDQDAGKRGKCPRCGAPIAVPHAPEPPALPVPAVPIEVPPQPASVPADPATERQKEYATSLGISFPLNIDKGTMSTLIFRALGDTEALEYEERERKKNEEQRAAQEKARTGKERRPTKKHKRYAAKHGIELTEQTSMNEILLLLDNIMKAQKIEKDKDEDARNNTFELIDKLELHGARLPADHEYTAEQLTEVINELIGPNGPPIQMCDEQEVVDYLESLENHVVLIIAPRSDPSFPSVYLSKKSKGTHVRKIVESAMTECTRFAIAMGGGELPPD